MFSGEENSRVQAHMDGDEFSAHILTGEAEYNVEVLYTLLVYMLYFFENVILCSKTAGDCLGEHYHAAVFSTDLQQVCGGGDGVGEKQFELH